MNRIEADLFIVNGVQNIGQRARWCAVLGGCTVAGIEFLTTAGVSGPATTYKPGLGPKRLAWCSPEFKRLHPELYTIFVAKCGQAGSKVTLTDSRAHAINRARVLKGTQVVMLVSAAELDVADRLLPFRLPSSETPPVIYNVYIYTFD
eukprot:9494489-Pyramimonas_sp.AAC.1